MALLRKEPLTGRPIILSPERGDRPHAFEFDDSDDESDCPFCPGNEHLTPPEIIRTGTGQWRTRVVPNRFPAVRPSAEQQGGFDEPANGRHEVIIETPSHVGCFDDYPLDHATEVVRVWMARAQVLFEDAAHRAVVLFKNRGRRAGASMAHPHSQIIALPFVPPRLAAQVDSSILRPDCLLCLSSERAQESPLLVESTASFAAIAPFASRFPYQVWIVPRRHQSTISEMTSDEVSDFSSILGSVVSRVRASLGDPAINWAFFQTRNANGGRFHWYMEIIPRITSVAGYEIATESFINVVDPEVAARRLRELAPAPPASC